MKYSCYYIIHLGCLWALLCTFILLLGLTYWPRAQCQFLFFPLFQCFEEKEYQTESKWNEINWRSYFWKESYRKSLECTSGKKGGSHEGGGAPTPLGCAPLPRGHPFGPPTYFFHPYIPTYPKTSKTEDRSGVPPPQASVATKNQSGPCSGTLPEGDPITGGHLHHPGAIHDEEGVVHPRGWGYVPVAMCLISLSLSLSCSWGGTILMYRELCYYSWILWCFSPSTLL